MIFLQNSSISQDFQYRRSPIAQSFGEKYRKMMSAFFSRQDGVKDEHRLGKNQSLSYFYLIMIMLLGVNNRHASESKCTYFVAREKRKYVNHEIKYHEMVSILNYYTDGSSQWKTFLEIDVPKK